MKDLLVIVLSAFINMFVWHDRNPAGVAFFCAAYALIPGKILLSVASLTGMAYALPMTAFIRYTGLITTVMMMAAVLRKVRPGLLTPVVMCGLMTLTMLTAGIGSGLRRRLAAAYDVGASEICFGTCGSTGNLLVICRGDRLSEGAAPCRKKGAYVHERRSDDHQKSASCIFGVLSEAVPVL